jgi:hypothetical protein
MRGGVIIGQVVELKDVPDDNPVWARLAHYVAALCVNLVLVASPEKIVLGTCQGRVGETCAEGVWCTAVVGATLSVWLRFCWWCCRVTAVSVCGCAAVRLCVCASVCAWSMLYALPLQQAVG